ncbi:MAG TPA: M56 family metallopeptidase [Croceibacterium sp.]|nr:M56 family metallopeptidase [Croceibacterium sp.]
MTVTAALLFELAWKSLLVSGATLGLLRLLRHRSPAERSWIAHIGLVALALLAPIALLVPDWNPLPAPVEAPLFEAVAPAAAPAEPLAFPAEGSAVAHAAKDLAAAPPEASAAPRAGAFAVVAYLLPMALLVVAMIVALVRLSAMHRRASVLVEAPWLAALAQAQRRMGFKHGTALLVSDELRSPVSWGVIRPIILLSPTAVAASREAEAIIAHELAHVARLDWAKLLVARLACALLWFNPLVWLLAREAHQLREEAADDAVLLSDVPDTDYASLLVNAARHDNSALLLAAHGVAPAKNSLHRRVLRVLDGNMVRRPAGGAWTSLCLVALFAVAAPLAALDPMARPPLADEEAEEHLVEPPAGLGGIIAGVVAHTVPQAIRQAVLDPRDLAKDEDRAEAEGREAAERDEHDEHDDEDAADQIIAMRAAGLSAAYIAAMRDAGFRGDANDLVGARSVGVTPEFAREMRRLDPTATLDDVIEAKAIGFSADFLGRMRQIFPGLSIDDAAELAAVGADAAFVRDMRALFPGLTAEQAVEMRAVGVTPEFVREMRRQGLSTRSPDEAVEGRLFAGSLEEEDLDEDLDIDSES